MYIFYESIYEDSMKIMRQESGRAIVKVPRKNLILRAIDNSEKESVKKLKEQVKLVNDPKHHVQAIEAVYRSLVK